MRAILCLMLFFSLSALASFKQTLERAQTLLAMKRYAEAVRILETDLGQIQGDRAYLDALAKAYRGRITELIAAKEWSEARRLFDRLRILDYKVTFDELRPRPVEDKPKLWIVEVTHAKATGGWSTATSMNFKIWHRDSVSRADEIANTLERSRRDLLRKWFGEEEFAWNRLCEVHVYPDTTAYAAATGMPSNVPSFFEQKGKPGAVESRLIVLRGDSRDLLIRLVPYEVAHAILSGRFGRFEVPRWVETGIAILSQDAAGADRFLKPLKSFDEQGKLFGMKALMELEFTSLPPRQEVFFAQSASLVQLLSNRSGPRKFLEFVQDGLLEGWEHALKQNYGLTDYDALTQRWRKHALFPGIIE